MHIDRLNLVCLLPFIVAACHDSAGPHGLRESAATSIAAGDVSTCALTSAGAVYCWGQDSLGQLGIGAHPGASQAMPVPVSGSHTFAALSGGGELMCALTPTSQSWCWGGLVFSPPTAFRDSVPTSIPGSVSLVTISSGPFHSCGLTTGGDAYCWGQNSYGQLGTGDTLARTTPVLVSGGMKWSAISAGFWHTCGVTNGKAYCWGNPIFGDLGNPVVDTNHTVAQATPLAVVGSLTVTSISAGSGYTCVVTTGGAGYCWGNNIIGQLGDGTDSSRDAPVPVAPASGLTFSTIAVSRANDIFSTTCGVTSGGAAYCWGSGTNGQIGNPALPSCNVSFGNGHYPCSEVPMAVTGGLTFAALAVGDLHVCGVTTAGAVFCWGGNAFGQLGNGTTQDNPAPTPVVGGLHVP
jgi:alpha-tubulin suppressor-like RCC1 family protein